MPPRLKKLIGLALLIPGLGAYLMAAAIIGERVPAFWLFQVLYYLVAGVLWAFPAMALLRWVEREPSRKERS